MTRCDKFCNKHSQDCLEQSGKREINFTWRDMREILWKTWHISEQRREQGVLFQVHGTVSEQRYECIGYVQSL